MASMKVAQLPKAGADFEIVEGDIPQPGPGHVRIRVQACDVCHSDVLVKEGGWPGLVYPRVPGHEVASVIDTWSAAAPRPGRDTGPPVRGARKGSPPAAVLPDRSPARRVYPLLSIVPDHLVHGPRSSN